MNTLIVYASKSGTTEKCVNLLKQELKDIHTANLQEESVNIDDYDIVVIGGAIRYGRLHKKVHQFIEENLPQLLQKDVALFICCGFPTEQHFTDNFPPELLKHAFIKEIFGGELNLESLSFFEKVIAKMAMRSAKTEEKPKILLDNIDHFVHEVQMHVH